MSTENIVITIREDGTREVARNLRNVGDESRNAATGVDSLRNALKTLVGALAINEIRKYADIWTQVRGKVNIFTHSAEETATVMDRLYKIAQDTRQPIAAMGNSFHQLSIAGSALGATQEQLLTFTQAIGNALAVQGTDANTARGGILQLGQAMNEGIVRAQEYNSMINAMPIVLKTVANNLEGVGGSLAKLRQRMLDGKLYSKDFFQALLKGAPELAALFEKSGKTIGQSMTIMENAMIKYVGRMDEAYGISAKFYDIAKLLADNIEDVAKALTIVASPFILQGLLAVGRALQGIAAAALANPYVALAAAITMAVTALYLYRDQLIIIEEGQVSFGDYAGAAWEKVTQFATEAVDYLKNEFPAAIESVLSGFGLFDVTLSDVTGVVKSAINLWIGMFSGIPRAFLEFWTNMPAALGNIFIDAFNGIKNIVSGGLNGIIDMINPILAKANIGEIVAVQFEETKPLVGKTFSEIADSVKGIMSDAIGKDFVGDAIGALDSLTGRAKELAKARHELANQKPVDLSLGGGAGEDFAGNNKGADKAAKELLRLEKQLASVVSAASPAEGAMLKLKFAEDILSRSLEKGLLTREQYNRYLALTREHYAEIANPMGELIKKLDDEAQALQLNARAREVEAKALDARRALMAKGAYVDEKDLQMLRDRYTGLQKLTEAIQAQDALLQNSVESRRNFVIQLQAIKKLLDDPASGFSQSDAQQSLFKMDPQAFAGTQAYVDNVANSYKDMFTRIQQMRDADQISQAQADQMRIGQTELLSQAIIRAQTEAAQARLDMGEGSWADSMLNSMSMVTDGFTTMQRGVSDSLGQMYASLTDGFANAAAAAIMKGEDLGDTIRAVANSAVEQLIASLIKLGIQWAVQAALGATLGASTTAASIAMAGTTAAAWAPAAAAVSLASFGGNSVPAMTGIASTYGLTEALSLSGMAHDGMDTIPKEGTWLLDQGERVVDRRTNGDLKDYLADKNSQRGEQSGGSNVVKINYQVINTVSDQVTTRQEQEEDENGDMTIRTIIERVKDSIAGEYRSRRGDVFDANQDAFGLQTNIGPR